MIQCLQCKNKNLLKRGCKAYPDGIPIPILKGMFDHRKPFDGDNGIQFAPYDEPVIDNRPDKLLPRVQSTYGIKSNVGTASSGNYGHEGRPGERGGSAPSGGAQGTSAGKSPISYNKAPAWRQTDLNGPRVFVPMRPGSASPEIAQELQVRLARNVGGMGKAVVLGSVEEIDATLTHNKYAIISGGRNGSAESGERDMDANDPIFHERSAELRAELERGGYSYTHGVGNYDGKEDSFLVMVHDHEEKEILKMGVKYNQQSVIVSEGGVAKQVYTHAATDKPSDDYPNGQFHAKGSYFVAQSYHDVDDKADNYYTELPFDGEGQYTRFSLDIDFDNEKQGYQMNTGGTYRNVGTESSGNFGHSGRPGERGGSAPSGGALKGTQGTSAGKSPKSGAKIPKAGLSGPAGDVTLDTHDTSKLSYMQEKTLCDSIRAEMPPKEEWENPRGYDIADMALAGFGGRGSVLVVARGEKGEFEGMAKYFTYSPPFAPEDKKIKIQFIASLGEMKHVGQDILSKIIEKNTGRAVELEADSDARTFYQHIGMHNEWGDGMTFHWSADEAAAFAERPRAHINVGTPSSGNYDHAGRPGERGGSAPGDGAPAPKTTPKSTKRAPAISDKDKRSIEKGINGYDRAETVAIYLPDDVQEYGKSNYKGQLKSYCNEGYQTINNVLRGTDKEYESLPKEMKDVVGKVINERISEIEKIISGSPDLPKGLTLWRGVGAANGERLAALEIGDTCHDKAFQSHTLNPFTAYTFAKGWGEGDVLTGDTFEVRDKSANGYQATVIRAVTKAGMKGVYLKETVSTEHEVLMPRGTEWKVIGKDKFEFHGDNYGQGTVHVITVVAT